MAMVANSYVLLSSKGCAVACAEVCEKVCAEALTMLSAISYL